VKRTVKISGSNADSATRLYHRLFATFISTYVVKVVGVSAEREESEAGVQVGSPDARVKLLA